MKGSKPEKITRATLERDLKDAIDLEFAAEYKERLEPLERVFKSPLEEPFEVEAKKFEKDA